MSVVCGSCGKNFSFFSIYTHKLAWWSVDVSNLNGCIILRRSRSLSASTTTNLKANQTTYCSRYHRAKVELEKWLLKFGAVEIFLWSSIVINHKRLHWTCYMWLQVELLICENRFIRKIKERLNCESFRIQFNRLNGLLDDELLLDEYRMENVIPSDSSSFFNFMEIFDSLIFWKIFEDLECERFSCFFIINF